MKEKTIAIITARGGSKRIPRKNIKEFCGKPIIEYSIAAALDSGVFSEVMVSTDDQEIAETALRAGARVPFLRSEATSNDYAVTADVIREVLEEYQKIGQVFAKGCCIYPTAPFITGRKLKTAMELLESEQADTVMPVVRYSFPPQRGVVIRNNLIEVQFPDCLNVRSQDLEPVYHDCGQFYCFNVKKFMTGNRLVGKNTAPVIMSELEVQDIDQPEDWEIAQMKYRLMVERQVD